MSNFTGGPILTKFMGIFSLLAGKGPQACQSPADQKIVYSTAQYHCIPIFTINWTCTAPVCHSRSSTKLINIISKITQDLYYQDIVGLLVILINIFNCKIM